MNSHEYRKMYRDMLLAIDEAIEGFDDEMATCGEDWRSVADDVANFWLCEIKTAVRCAHTRLDELRRRQEAEDDPYC